MIVLMLAFVHACATVPVDRRADDANNEGEKYDALSSATPGQSNSAANGGSVDWITLTLLGLIASIRRQRTGTASKYPGSKAAGTCPGRHPKQ